MDDERPLSGARISSGLVNRQFSVATSAAAGNLLSKAVRALESGQRDRAGTFVRRALDLPHDEFEDMDPATWSAHMLLFTSISDDLETLPVSDTGWLDRAAETMDGAARVAAAEVRACLRSFLDGAYELSTTETRRLKAMTRGLPVDLEPLADVPDDLVTRVSAVLDVLAAVIHHRNLTRA